MTDNCRHVQKIKTSIQLGILSPDKWHCTNCSTTESVWACLSCTNFACGRYIAEHALHHFKTTGHPLCIEVNEKFVFCYICDDFVLNDNAPGDIKLLRMALDAVTAQNFEELSKQRRGRHILRYHIQEAKMITRRLLMADEIQTAVTRHRISRLSWALRLWWSNYVERKRLEGAAARLRLSSGKGRSPLMLSPAFTGLRNLGNTCYINSVLQVLRHTAPFANFIMSHEPSEVLPQAKRRRTTASTIRKCDSSNILTNCVVSSSGNFNNSSSSPSINRISQKSIPVDVTKPINSISDLPVDPHSLLSESLTSLSAPNFLELKKPDLSRSLDSVGGLNGGRCAKSNSSDLIPKLLNSGNPGAEASLPSHSVYEELRAVFRALWTGHRTIISPSSLLCSVWNTLPSFKGYKQQDAQEFLSMFLDRLQSELHGSTDLLPVNSRDFVNRTFQGYSVSHIRCCNCDRVACTEEPFSELSLALPSACYTGESSECELLELLQQFVSPTPIDGKSYVCQACNRKVASGETDAPLSSDGLQANRTIHDTYHVDKFVSVALSRLPSTTNECSRTFPDLRVSYNRLHAPSCHLVSSSSSSSLSENVLSASASYSSSEDLDRSPLLSFGLPEPSVLGSDSFGVKNGVQSSLEDAEHCDSSPYLTCATQTIRLNRLPRVLRLHIKRFRWIGRQREKVGCHVSFPLILDMSSFMLNDLDRAECGQIHLHDTLNSFSPRDVSQSQTRGSCPALGNSQVDQIPAARRCLYHLTGVIVHHGRGFQSGHYTAYCLNDQPECWLNCNDANVTLCDFDEVAACQAYLLFYSELVPNSPYPAWFNGFKNTAGFPYSSFVTRNSLKRSHSTTTMNDMSSVSTQQYGPNLNEQVSGNDRSIDFRALGTSEVGAQLETSVADFVFDASPAYSNNVLVQAPSNDVMSSRTDLERSRTDGRMSARRSKLGLRRNTSSVV